MVGRSVLESLDRPEVELGPVVLDVRGVSALNDRDLPAMRDVSLQVRAGEIVGVAAVAGNGQSELAEVITGLRPCRGEILVGGEPVANRSASTVLRQGVAHVPEDRTSVGSAPNLSLTDNLIMKRYRESPVARGWLVDDASARSVATELRDSYRIASPTVDTQVRLLSGGNLQRAILAREIETKPGLLIAVQPTRGLDVGAIEIRPPAPARPPDERRGDPPDLRGARRDPCPRGSHRRDVRGSGRGLDARGRGGHRPDRAADDRRVRNRRRTPTEGGSATDAGSLPGVPA